MPEHRTIGKMQRHEVTERLMTERPEWKQQYAHYMAGKLKRITQRRELGWFDALRVLGITSDPTPLEALKNMEAAS